MFENIPTCGDPCCVGTTSRPWVIRLAATQPVSLDTSLQRKQCAAAGLGPDHITVQMSVHHVRQVKIAPSTPSSRCPSLVLLHHLRGTDSNFIGTDKTDIEWVSDMPVDVVLHHLSHFRNINVLHRSVVGSLGPLRAVLWAPKGPATTACKPAIGIPTATERASSLHEEELLAGYQARAYRPPYSLIYNNISFRWIYTRVPAQLTRQSSQG